MNDKHGSAPEKIVLRALDKGDLHRYRAIRLSALSRAPLAFGSSFEEENAYSDSVFARRLEQVNGNIIFGAFDGENLLGTAGVFRHERKSERHRGTLWGVYVAPEARGLELGKALVQKVIEHAAAHVIVLDAKVVATNEPAKRIYEALGFKTYGTEPKSLFVQGQYLDQELLYIDFSDAVWKDKIG
ncbi:MULTISPECIES: GNAT family N-acetyltransferase [Brucella]|uniref:GNAT family N-acetyltransferase n=2 Tax=Ochrobactrum TaxID=528 RepID=A0ABD5JXQ6_9HYPH|nr:MULTISPECIES: GNAT family N-acetyltransferase [Brucella]MCI0999846.1 GNAT family N-acetyltransferase [Ochrobactrum sp. C6C9]RRD24336.1 GNAT family N-acetyltransferase [Brucellaceae bacterium VT-16-1752]WHT41702.1 GNAT family N-acetyltransferase [Ochrobactrum sp. SSR]MDX4073887.1 GNAT family N-acetyltransferase [Brucella sp. NBRC 113783]WHS31821.1 GNAT family N-acetyltransferase [Brucella sp. NM4]